MLKYILILQANVNGDLLKRGNIDLIFKFTSTSNVPLCRLSEKYFIFDN